MATQLSSMSTCTFKRDVHMAFSTSADAERRYPCQLDAKSCRLESEGAGGIALAHIALQLECLWAGPCRVRR